ncbi:thioredoxin family protein [Nocardioides sp. zg-1228]|nr:thioredoxin family protein [Nocardioides sp. zg-1228]QSF59726.1 thioredoxin family protein [Nocardioides sp. zg-1228]
MDGRFRETRAARPTSPAEGRTAEGQAAEGQAAEGAAGAAAGATAPTEAFAGAEVVTAVGRELGERATLLQFSSAFCAPCRATRRVLDEVSGLVDGVAHVEVDAEHHLEATRALGILRTPTTVVLDASGAEVVRASGAPTRDQVLTALARV